MELYVGIMSGTSVDGIDAVLVDFDGGNAQMIANHSQPFPNDLKRDVVALLQTFTVHLKKLGEIDHRLGMCYANCVNDLLRKANIDPQIVKAIGCHGQTIYHQPRGKYPFTMQIGDGNLIAALTGITTITDFRRMDMAFKGGGAPLTPAFHKGFLGSDKECRAILNLGGIANVTILDKERVVGLDSGPANCLIDLWIQLKRGCKYDDEGLWAKSGRVDERLLENLLAEKYFSLDLPKSTGKELFNIDWLMKILESYPDIEDEDVQATLTELTAVTVANDIKKYAHNVDGLYACGGGANNTFLLERVAHHLPGVRILTTTELGVPTQWVEAIAFAWLAMRRCNEQTGNLPQVTGANRCVVLGALYKGH